MNGISHPHFYMLYFKFKMYIYYLDKTFRATYLTIPFNTFPNTTCFPSNQDVFLVVKKNCEPLVSLPALAMDNHPAP